MKKEKTSKKELCELREPIWGIVDGINCLASGLTYEEAEEKLNGLSGNGIIVTNAVAEKLPSV